jgi:hypothetical protein
MAGVGFVVGVHSWEEEVPKVAAEEDLDEAEKELVRRMHSGEIKTLEDLLRAAGMPVVSLRPAND